MKRCETCQKFQMCWKSNPEPFCLIDTTYAQGCISNNYSNWVKETEEQRKKKDEYDLCLLMLLIMGCFVLAVMALLYIVT